MDVDAPVASPPVPRLARVALALAWVSIALFIVPTMIVCSYVFAIPAGISDILGNLSMFLLPLIALILGFPGRKSETGKAAILISGLWLAFWVAIARFWLLTNP